MLRWAPRRANLFEPSSALSSLTPSDGLDGEDTENIGSTSGQRYLLRSKKSKLLNKGLL